MEVDAIPQQSQEKIAQIDSADLVLGILANFDPKGIATLCGSLRTLEGSPRIVVLRSNTDENATAPTSPTAEENSVSVIPWSLLDREAAGLSLQKMSAACESLFTVCQTLKARACCVIASEMEGVTPQWVRQFVEPLVQTDFDLVMPYYSPRKLQGLLNTGILYPLLRCLYGKRIHNPLGPDVGVSRQLAQRVLDASRNAKVGPNRTHPLASLEPVAVCNNLQICEMRVGARVYPPMDWLNVSSLVAQVLGPIFLDMERNAACWQKVRGSVPVPTRGEHSVPQPEAETLDVNRMVETFRLGVHELQEIWALVLPPSTLFELRKLSRLSPDQVHIPDELWARIIFDFALAHRLRTINRDHLLRSMTPLYLAWAVSYARELEKPGALNVEERIERLSIAYEATKPYLVSRWRWPDRFNP